MKLGKTVVWILLLAALAVLPGCDSTHDASSPTGGDLGGAPAPDHPLRIVSWNIRCLRNGAEEAFCNTDNGSSHVRSELYLDVLRGHARRLDADVVFAQEVADADALAQLFPGWEIHATGVGEQQVAVATAPDADASLSDIRPLDALRVSAQMRPGLEVTVRHRDAAVRVLALHLKAGCAHESLETDTYDCRILRQQLQVLVDWIAAREQEGQPYMLVGDFNRELEGSDAFAHALADAAASPLHRTTRGVETTCWRHHPDAPHPRWFIDHHILSAGAVEAWGTPVLQLHGFTESFDDAWLYLSDHCPIIAAFP